MGYTGVPARGSANPDYGQLTGWLSSGAFASGALDYNEDAPAADTVPLVSARRVGTPEEVPAIRAEVRPFANGGKHTSEIAWWVLDESQKARVNLTGESLPDAALIEDKYAAFLSPRCYGVGELASFAGVTVPLLERSTSIDQLKLAQQQTGMANPDASDYFHDIGMHSRGVLANVRDGGLKTDLTTAFQHDAIFNRDIANYDADGDGRFERPNEPVRLLVPSGGLSRAYPYRGPSQLAFYFRETDAEGQVQWLLAGSARLPAGASEYLLIFRANQDAKAYRIAVYPNARIDFPPGSYRFFNFTPSAVAGKLNDQEFMVQSGASETLRPNPPPDNSLVTFLATKTGDEWKVLFKTKWPWKEDVQTMVFLTPGPQQGKVRVKMIRERILDITGQP